MCHYLPCWCLAEIWPISCQLINRHAVRHRSKNRFQIIIVGRWPCMGDKLSYVLFSWWIFFAGKNRYTCSQRAPGKPQIQPASQTCATNDGGVNFVHQKPEIGKLSIRANSEHCLLVCWRIRTRHFACRKKKKKKNDKRLHAKTTVQGLAVRLAKDQ